MRVDCIISSSIINLSNVIFRVLLLSAPHSPHLFESASADTWLRLVQAAHMFTAHNDLLHQLQITRISRSKLRYGFKGFLFSCSQMVFPFKGNDYSGFINRISHLNQLMYKVFWRVLCFICGKQTAISWYIHYSSLVSIYSGILMHSRLSKGPFCTDGV